MKTTASLDRFLSDLAAGGHILVRKELDPAARTATLYFSDGAVVGWDGRTGDAWVAGALLPCLAMLRFLKQVYQGNWLTRRWAMRHRRTARAAAVTNVRSSVAAEPDEVQPIEASR